MCDSVSILYVDTHRRYTHRHADESASIPQATAEDHKIIIIIIIIIDILEWPKQ